MTSPAHVARRSAAEPKTAHRPEMTDLETGSEPFPGGAGRSPRLLGRGRSVREWAAERAVVVAGQLAIVFVALIFAFLLWNAIPLFQQRGIGEVLSGTMWAPTRSEPQFGMLPLIAGSALVTAGALLLAVPLGIACALFISEVCPPRLQEIVKAIVELLAAVPSVVFGFLGLLVVGPWAAKLLHLPVGLFAALGALILAYMALPTIVSVAEDAIRAVPAALRANSLALGATRWQTLRHVVLPAARSGLVCAVLLGMGRAIGETMTVLMVTGNSAVMPKLPGGALKPVRTLTATIAAEMGETPIGTEHYHALFTVGLVLFAITFLTSTIADVLVRRPKGEGS